MYITQILWFLTWPALIITSYFIIRYALQVYENKSKDA